MQQFSPSKLEAASVPQMKSQLLSAMQIKAARPVLHYTYHYKPLPRFKTPATNNQSYHVGGIKCKSAELTSRRDRLIIDLMSAAGWHIHL